MHLGQSDVDRGQWMTSMTEELHRVMDPPEWTSLDDRPALQGAARATFEEGCRWVDTKRRPLLPPEHRPGLFEWRTTKDLAERVAGELGVSVGAINGCVMVFLVEGVWWELVSPGVAFCSFGATQDPKTAESIQRAVFTPGAAPDVPLPA